MAVGRQFNWEGQQRVDVPHLRLVESGVVYDFDTLAGVTLTGRNPYVIQGFAMAAFVGGQAAATLQLVTAGSTIFHYGASENGTMLQVPSTRAAETLAVTNPRVRGGFTASQTNYIGIDFLRSADSTTSDIVQFLDATTLAEAPRTIPLGRTLDYVISISTTPFSANTALCPIAKVVTDASNNVVSVTDARTLYFRLGYGGDSPTPLGTYTWPQGQGVGITPTNEAASFTGGDKAITNEKDWKSAIMTMIWSINAGEYWYSPTQMTNTLFVDGGLNNFTWAPNVLTWANPLAIVFSGSTAVTNVINAGNITIAADNECMYVDFDRYTDGAILTPHVAPIQTLGGSPSHPGIRYVIAWRVAGTIWLRNYPVAVNASIVGTATTLVQGSVKINSVDANPYAVIADALGGNAIAAGLTRGSLGAGVLSVGTGANDSSITLGKLAATIDAAAAFTGTAASNRPGILAVGGTANGHGVDATGTGSGRGVFGTGGTTDGTGVYGKGGATNGVGVHGEGTGNGAGGSFQGTTTGYALIATAGVTGACSNFVGAAGQDCVRTSPAATGMDLHLGGPSGTPAPNGNGDIYWDQNERAAFEYSAAVGGGNWNQMGDFAIMKNNDISTSSNVMGDVTNMRFYAWQNQSYVAELTLWADVADAAGWSVQFTGPGATQVFIGSQYLVGDLNWTAVGPPVPPTFGNSAIAGGHAVGLGAAGFSIPFSMATMNSAVPSLYRIYLAINNATASGYVQLQFKSNTGGGGNTTTIFKGSSLKWRRVAIVA